MKRYLVPNPFRMLFGKDLTSGSSREGPRIQRPWPPSLQHSYRLPSLQSHSWQYFLQSDGSIGRFTLPGLSSRSSQKSRCPSPKNDMTVETDGDKTPHAILKHLRSQVDSRLPIAGRQIRSPSPVTRRVPVPPFFQTHHPDLSCRMLAHLAHPATRQFQWRWEGISA